MLTVALLALLACPVITPAMSSFPCPEIGTSRRPISRYAFISMLLLAGL
jgi:hypothetical protein